MMMSQMPPTNQGPMFNQGYSGNPQEAPGATASMVMGIITIVFNIPIVGLIVAYIGFQKANEARALIAQNPGMYTNAGVAQAGYILCIIGMCLGAISTLCGCGYFILIAAAIVGGASGAGGP